jgi:SAM-dependent methyltransferase
MQEARDTFATKSDAYASYRPRYPAALYDWILTNCPRREAAWDCATGNGQAAVDLASHFARIDASDISQEQVAEGESKANIFYTAGPAEATSYAANSFDLIVVAQALHWFDYDRYWAEIYRVARDGALFCAWGYAWMDLDQEVDETLVVPFRAIIEPFWASNNAILWRGYQPHEIGFPFQLLSPPSLAIEVRWSVGQLIDYMETWSATKRARADEHAGEALDRVVGHAARLLRPDRMLDIRMPLSTIAGRVEKA